MTKTEDRNFNRDWVVNWLENMQSQGAFDNVEEKDVNFKKLSDEDLEWYFSNWAYEDYLMR